MLLLERDAPGVTGDADPLFECWERPGIARDAAAPPPGGPARAELLAAIKLEPTTA